MAEPTNTELLTAIQGLGQRFDGVETRIDGVHSRLALIEDRVTEQGRTLRAHTEIFSELVLKMNGLDTKLEIMRGTLTQVIDSIVDLRRDFQNHSH